MHEIIGHIVFGLLVLFLFYPVVYFFKSDNNKLEKNIDEYERNNKKRKEIR